MGRIPAAQECVYNKNVTESPTKDPSSTREDTPDQHVILYDGVCNLCNASVKFIANRDATGRYHFAHLQSKTGQRLARAHGIEPTSMDSFVLVENRHALVKSDAWLSILGSLGGIWAATRIFRLIPRAIRDAIYDLVGRFRYRVFGRTTQCQVPGPDLYDRFLDFEERSPGNDSD